MIKQILIFLIPHFVTEDVAVYEYQDGLYPTIPAKLVLPDDDKPYGVIRMKCLAWLMFGLFPKQISEVVDWDDWVKLNKGGS